MRLIGRRDAGGVSIFIVIFTALLLTVVTTSFVQLMIRNQQQASTNDLSQSAYDAALAGVEDAKRALVALAKCENKTDGGCPELREQFNDNAQECEFLGGIGLVNFGSDHEVKVNGGGNADLNQAYTCVKIDPNSPDHRGVLNGDSGGEVIRLRSKGNFDRVKISWFSDEDLKDSPGANIGFPAITGGNAYPLLPHDLWSPSTGTPMTKTPPLLRAQLIQFKKRTIQLSQFNEDARTSFLYPVGDGTRVGTNWKGDKSGVNNPLHSSCTTVLSVSLYHCQATLEIPDLSSGSVSVANREIYLQLAAIYGRAHYSIELFNNGTSDNDRVSFSGGQATVDSTGRAANLFRRISARVSVKSEPLKYPEAALTTKGDLCKNFFVTNIPADYVSEVCNPSP